jgi:hypothetical protein
MPLLGSAAMLLSFDVVPEAIPEHDDWHTHEHLPERLAIPGFLRGTRWVVRRGRPRYLVLYEVERLATLTSDAYLARLNAPSPWTSRMMPHYRGMSRGFCSVTASFGLGMGPVALLIRCEPDAEAADPLRRWLVDGTLPRHVSSRGIGSAHLLEGVVAPAMTNEQRMRGTDAGIDWAVLITGYSEQALTHLADADLNHAHLTRRGATNVTSAVYAMDYSLTCTEMTDEGRGDARLQHSHDAR